MGTQVDTVRLEKLGNFLKDDKNPLKARFRALFTLRNLPCEKSVQLIGDCFSDSSALLKHELAYCLGQMQDQSAVSILSNVLANLEEHPMVRHEAAEALGAIGTDECLRILRKYQNDKIPEVAETVELALERINQIKNNLVTSKLSPYESIDPAFPLRSSQDVAELKAILLDESKPLYIRYQSMFALRDICTAESIEALNEGFKGSSALFRHEIAFVLGQIQSPLSIKALEANLREVSENEMVRHECAEALGAIGTKECEIILTAFLKDSVRVVRESCEVALDICEYEMTGDFQYANGLQTL